MLGKLIVSAAAAAGALWSAAAAAQAAPRLGCDTAAIQAVSPADTTIVSAAATAAPVPHCRVDGYVTTTNPGPNKVNFRLQLPDQGWTQRYFFIGLGATAGYVPTDATLPVGNPMLAGFAVAGTDTGHQNTADWSFMGADPAKAVDHIHRGGHVVAVATQGITRAYYGVDKMYRYHSGCSGGGRMGTEAMIRHPEDYDGILIGANGMGPTFAAETMIAFIHLGQQINREPGAWLSPAKLQMLDHKVTQHCDLLDGAKDDVIWSPEKCTYDFRQLACKSADGPDCLTAPELRTVEAILAGPPGPNGPIKRGYPISNMSEWTNYIGGPTPWPSPLTPANANKASIGYFMGNSLARAYFGPDYDGVKQFRFKDQKQLEEWAAGGKRVGFGLPFTTDLSPFKKAGGKVIWWNGVSDPCCHYQDMASYQEAVAERMGGAAALESFSRLYVIPGMGHCRGGTGPHDAPDLLLQKLVDWVEKGEAPGAVVTHRGERATPIFHDPNRPIDPKAPVRLTSGGTVPPPSGAARDFLLCPYPTYAKFNGKKGGELEAENWSCK